MTKYDYEKEIEQWRNTTAGLFRQLEKYEQENFELREQKEQMRKVAVVMQEMLHHYQNDCIVVELKNSTNKLIRR